MAPVTSTELVAVQHYVEACADNITQMPDLKEKEIALAEAKALLCIDF